MGTDLRLVVAVRAGMAPARTHGSGYLVADRLVLTAACACDGLGDHQSEVAVVLPDTPREFSCRVVWTEPGVPQEIGAALLEVADPAWPRLAVPTPRWGRFTGRGGWLTCQVAASLAPARHGRPDLADPLTGRVGPYGAAVTDGLRRVTDDLTVDISGGDRDGQADAGLSGNGLDGRAGAAVIHDGLIAGVVRAGDGGGGPGFLPVIPAARFVDDASFGREMRTATWQVPQAESLELAGWLAPWPVARPQTPADLLRPELAVVAFTGRGTELDELAAWCRSPASAATRAVLGAPGSGKTRLGRELAARMHQDGWVAGFVGDTDLRAGIEGLAAMSRPVLLIVDDAEARTDIAPLISQVMAKRHRPPIRCLLLSADFGAWWQDLRNSSPEVSAAGNRLPLSLTYPDAAGQEEMMPRAARELANGLRELLTDYAHAEWVQRERVAARSARFASAGRDSTHQVVLAALLEDDPEAAGNAADVLLKHEERRWAAAARECQVPVSDIRIAVAVAHCYRPANAARADAALSCVPGLRGEQMEPRRRQIAGWLSGDVVPQGGSGATWRPFLSRRLAESHIARTVNRDLMNDLLRMLGLSEATQTLIVLARASAADSADAQRLGEHLTSVVTGNPRALGPAAAAAAGADPLDPLIQAVAALVQRTELDPIVIRDISRAIPVGTGVINDIAIRAHERIIGRLRGPAAGATATGDPALAAELTWLGRRLAGAGATARAVDATREAVQIYRDLSADTPAGFRHPWAAALLDLAECLEPSAAGGAARQAVELYRELAEVDPPRFLPELASSLLRLGSLAECDREMSTAERARAESVRILRSLCQTDPAAFKPVLAAALETWICSLDRTGQQDPGTSAAEELAGVYAELSLMHPPGYLHLHAAALESVSERLAADGDLAAALCASESAVQAHRLLVAESPDVGLERLADALGWLSGLLCASGSPEQARAAGAEAVTCCRISADQGSPVRLARLASALTTLAVPLGELGRWEGCRSALEEAVDLYRQLAAAEPEQHEAGLAAALTNLAVALGERDHAGESQAAAQEAVDRYRQLAAGDAEQHQAGLAVALTNLAVSLGDDRRQQEAVTVAEEAVSLLSGLPDGRRCDRGEAAARLALAYQLAAQGRYAAAAVAAAAAVRLHQACVVSDAEICAPAFGAAVRCLADLRRVTGQYEAALQDATQAADFYRRLQADGHGRYSEGLAEALGTLSGCQASVQLASQAQRTAEEAVELCRRLAETDAGHGEALLAAALAQLAIRCDQADQPRLAAEACAEAVECYQRMTGPYAEKHAHEHLVVLCDHARRLGLDGRVEGVGIAQGAVRFAIAQRGAGREEYVPLDHAMALTTLAECLRWQSRRAEGRVAARQAAASCHHDIEGLVPDAADAQWADLADRERTISRRLYALGHLVESLDVVGLAVRGYRGAADAGPLPSLARYGLASSLQLRSAALRDLPRRRAAARAADQAIVLYRELAAEDASQFELPLASALDDLAPCQRRSKARTLRAEARAIRNAEAGQPASTHRAR